LYNIFNFDTFYIRSIILLYLYVLYDVYILYSCLFVKNVPLSYEWFYSTTQQKISDYMFELKIKEILTCYVIIP